MSIGPVAGGAARAAGKAAAKAAPVVKKVVKKTVVKTKITIDGKEYFGEGTNKTSVSSTILQLQDENLPFERTEFSSALRKSLESAFKK